MGEKDKHYINQVGCVQYLIEFHFNILCILKCSDTLYVLLGCISTVPRH